MKREKLTKTINFKITVPNDEYCQINQLTDKKDNRYFICTNCSFCFPNGNIDGWCSVFKERLSFFDNKYVQHDKLLKCPLCADLADIKKE